MKTLTVAELIKCLEDYPQDALVGVSVDVSTGDDDAHVRALGDVVELQIGPTEVTLLCIGNLNEGRVTLDRGEVTASMRTHEPI